jgi:hypothetical protein
MRNLKVKLSVLAMLVGLGSAFATRKPLDDNHKWSRDAVSGAYTDITGQQLGTDYSCDNGSDVCTATYPAAQDPNVNASGAISVETGVFN